MYELTTERDQQTYELCTSYCVVRSQPALLAYLAAAPAPAPRGRSNHPFSLSRSQLLTDGRAVRARGSTCPSVLLGEGVTCL
jgi:hypothetical protein